MYNPFHMLAMRLFIPRGDNNIIDIDVSKFAYVLSEDVVGGSQVLVAFLRPNGSLLNSYFPLFTEKDLFSRSRSASIIWW